MFDFENLEVYKKAKAFNAIVGKMILTDLSLDGTTKNQLRRASLSIVLNIAEGSSRFSKQALEIFEVSPEQYTDYLAKNAFHILWPADTTVINWVESLISLKAINATLIYFASRHHGSKVALKHLDAALRAMKKVTEEAEDQSRKTATTNLF